MSGTLPGSECHRVRERDDFRLVQAVQVVHGNAAARPGARPPLRINGSSCLRVRWMVRDCSDI